MGCPLPPHGNFSPYWHMLGPVGSNRGHLYVHLMGSLGSQMGANNGAELVGYTQKPYGIHKWPIMFFFGMSFSPSRDV